jgi:hypothetical protein
MITKINVHKVLEYDEELLEYDVEVLLEIIWTLLGVVCHCFVPYKRQEGASLCFL